MKDEKKPISITEKLKRICEIDRHADKLKAEKNKLKLEIIASDLPRKDQGRSTQSFGRYKLVIKGDCKKKLDKSKIIEDYKHWPDTLKNIFSLEPKLKMKEYKEAFSIHKDTLAQYVTEQKPTYTIDVQEVSPEDGVGDE